MEYPLNLPIDYIALLLSSVYPNIPSRSDGEFRQFLYKFYLLSIGILGPEILLFIALGQWTSARAAVKVCIPFLTMLKEMDETKRKRIFMQQDTRSGQRRMHFSLIWVDSYFKRLIVHCSRLIASSCFISSGMGI